MLQAASFLGDDDMADFETEVLAAMCHKTAANAGDVESLCCSVTRLSERHRHAFCLRLVKKVPLSTLLTKFPMLLHRPLLHALLQSSSKVSASGHTLSLLQLDVPTDTRMWDASTPHWRLGEAACPAICLHLAGLPALAAVSLAGHRLCDSSTAAIVAALRPHSQLTSLDLLGNSCRQQTLHMLSATLPCWPHLQKLHLQGPSGSSQAAAEMLAGSLATASALTSLRWDAGWANGACLAASVQLQPALRLLQAHGAICDNLCALSYLTHLELDGAAAELAGVPDDDLVLAVSAMSSLQHLKLSGKRHALDALPCSKLLQLRHLHLRGCCRDGSIDAMVDGALVDVFEALPLAAEQGHASGLRSITLLTALTHLSLGASDRDLEDDFVYHLGRVLPELRSLEVLELLSEFGDMGTQMGYLLGSWGQAHHMTSLSFSVKDPEWCPVTNVAPSSVHRLAVKLFPSEAPAGRTLAHVVALTQLTALSLNGFEAADDQHCVGQRFLEQAHQLQHLQELSLLNVCLEDSRWALVRLCMRLSVLRELCLAHCSLSREFS